ncbi:sensor histidine kinase [Herminiimonas sp. KBW02]|uniref:sensor histidine kinase n=1 Tax=Herminiimonas sp. KBW02 TaxID=2153363 RepID=UPI001315277F|nr:sensor histidine kinase [Herminiimonas sp. KBW02]
MLFSPPMKRLYLFLLLFSLLLPVAGWAQSAIDLRATTHKASGGGHLSMLRDPDAQLTPDQALASGAWQAIPAALSAGYTSDAIWLRLVVVRAADAPQDWLVRFTNALLDDVRLYRPDGAHAWREQRAGEDTGRASWPLDTRNVVLPVQMETIGQEVWLIRLQSKNAMSTNVEVWSETAFGDTSRREYLFYGLYFGCLALLIILHVFFWRMTREKQSGLYLLYVLMNTLTELMTVALPQQVLHIPVTVSDPLLGLSMCVSLAVGVHFSLQQLELHPVWPRFSRVVLYGARAVALLSALFILSGRFSVGVILMQQVAMALIVVFISIALWLLGRGHKPARFFLLVFGIFYAGAVVSYLRNMAVVPTNFWTDHAIAIGALLHMILMSLRLNLRYDGLRRDKEIAQAETVNAIRELNEGLEVQVAKRTAALQQEIAQRVQLEQELRQSLEAERRIKEEQQDFVAMVSHEFRTPLAIINTTAQQIAKNLDAARERTLQRCQNLRDAARRMAALVDEYLTADRMDASTTAFRPALCDARQVLDATLAEWPEDRITLVTQPLPSSFFCDRGLLQVALRNLLANADRHSTPGRAIHVDVACDESGALHIAVSNHGEPVPEDEIGRLFQKYFRGHAAQHQPGAGLGLYLVQRIAEMHGGSVRLDNDGSARRVTFSLCLPPSAPA